MSWPLVRLSDFCITGSGGTPSRKNPEYFEGEIPWIKSGDLRENIVTQATEFITDDAIKNSSAKIVSKGSILLAMYGATVGRMALLGIDAATNQAVCNITPDQKKAFTKYVYYALLHKVPEFLESAVGGAQPNISQGIIKDTLISLPPLDEQKRIAAILDKADAIRRKRQQAIALADDFLRSVFLEMFGDPVTNPKGWEVKQLGDGIKKIYAGWSAKGADHPCKDNEFGVLKISAVTSGFFKRYENKMIPFDDIPEDKKLIFPKKGDLIFSRANTRDLVAATCIIPQDENNLFLPDKLWLIESNKDKILPEFMHYMISNKKYKDTLTCQATGTSGSMLNISKEKFGSSNAIFPDISIQIIFKDIFWKTQNLIGTIERSFLNADDIFNALSQQAFSGKL